MECFTNPRAKQNSYKTLNGGIFCLFDLYFELVFFFKGTYKTNMTTRKIFWTPTTKEP